MTEETHPDLNKDKDDVDNKGEVDFVRREMAFSLLTFPLLIRSIRQLLSGQGCKSCKIAENSGNQNLEREAYIGRLQSSLESTYQIKVDLDTHASLEQKWQFINSLHQVLSKYPPTFFTEFRKIIESQRKLQASVPRDEEAKMDEIKSDVDKPTFALQRRTEFLGSNLAAGCYSGEFGKIELNMDTVSNWTNHLHHEIGHFIHHLLANLSLDLSDADPETKASEFLELETYPFSSQVKFLYKMIKQRLAYPGYASGYAQVNTHEDFAEMWEKLMSQKGLILPESKHEALKIQGIKQMVCLVTDGLLNDVYWQALKEDEVNSDFWKHHQPELNFFTDDEKNQVIYLTDLDPGPEEQRLPALVKLHLAPRDIEKGSNQWHQASDHPLQLSKNELRLKPESLQMTTGQRVSMLLQVNGRYSRFLSLYPGTYVKVELQAFDEKLSFQVGVDQERGVLISEVKKQPVTNLLKQEGVGLTDLETLRTYFGIQQEKWSFLRPIIEKTILWGEKGLFLVGSVGSVYEIVDYIKTSRKQIEDRQDNNQDEDQDKNKQPHTISRRSVLKLMLGAGAGSLVAGTTGTAFLQTRSTPGFDIPDRELLEKRLQEMRERHSLLSDLLFPAQQEIEASQGQMRHYLMPLPDGEEIKINPQVSNFEELGVLRIKSDLFWLKDIKVSEKEGVVSGTLLNKRFDRIDAGHKKQTQDSMTNAWQLGTLTTADLWVIKRSLARLTAEGYSWKTADVSTVAYYYDSTDKKERKIIAEIRDTQLRDQEEAYGRRLEESIISQSGCEEFEYCYVRLDAGLPTEQTFIFFSLKNDASIDIATDKPIIHLGAFEGWDSDWEQVPATADITK